MRNVTESVFYVIHTSGRRHKCASVKSATLAIFRASASFVVVLESLMPTIAGLAVCRKKIAMVVLAL